MSHPSEPLLPVEPERPSRLKLWLGLGGVGLLALIVVAWLLRDGTPADKSAPTTDERPGRAAKKEGAPAVAEPKRLDGDERQAKELYEKAESFERAQPGEYEGRISRWREVVTTYPTTMWARKADDQHRAVVAAYQIFLDREFDSTRKNAQALSAAGHYLDAIEALRSYKAAQAREVLKRRADLEIEAIENASRAAFNETAIKAKDLASKGDYAAATALFEAVTRTAIPEVAARCAVALTQIQAASAAQARHLEVRKGEEVRRSVREETAPRVLAQLRARQYDEALKDLGAAAAALPAGSVKEEIAAERASVADASSFWEAFLKTLKARTGQEVGVLMGDGRRLTGKVARIQPDRFVLESADGGTDVPFDKLHADLLVGWTIGKSLPAEDPVTYVKAALFFFCDGRDDLAKLYLATARELNGSVDAAEKVFREGYLRAAMFLKK